MPFRRDPLQELDDALSQLSTVDKKVAKVLSHFDELFSEPPTALHHQSGGNIGDPAPALPYSEHTLNILLLKHGISASDMSHAQNSLPPHARLILDTVPCAFNDPYTREECLKDGAALYTSCRVVVYCSKVGSPILRSFLN